MHKNLKKMYLILFNTCTHVRKSRVSTTTTFCFNNTCYIIPDNITYTVNITGVYHIYYVASTFPGIKKQS